MRLKSGITARLSLLLVSLALVPLTSCLYRFAGGGLPSSIKTVAILPFENETSEPTLAREINVAVREAVESRLGLRQGSEGQADALVRGTISRYESGLPVAYNGDDQQPVNVTRQLVQITVSVEIIDQRANKPLWERSGLIVKGDYAPGQEADGRRKALAELITNIVEGAQSQW